MKEKVTALGVLQFNANNWHMVWGKGLMTRSVDTLHRSSVHAAGRLRPWFIPAARGFVGRLQESPVDAAQSASARTGLLCNTWSASPCLPNPAMSKNAPYPMPVAAVIPPAEPHPSLPPEQAANDPDLPLSEPSEGLDRWLHAQVGKVTAALSPPALLLAGLDWGAHLAMSPAKQS
ncbi:MAG TPA: poly-beta-hydroxybutyrate polymerase N-terminal domain-containing protein, partial [Burkholderiaceae bacterium]|nr:poly-beta-hydroxybutyrate polymerase N-terminal domain-containing protein [Burkholderiaceae bacterium]